MTETPPSRINDLVDGRTGRFFANRFDTYVGQSLIKYGEFSWLEFTFLQQIVRAGDVIVEVGANIGAHTVGLARLAGNTGRIVAFEPQPMVFQTLCANVMLNGLETVDCLPYAIGAQRSEVLFPYVDYGQARNFGGISVEDLQAENFDRGLPVQIYPLDDIFQLPRLELLKIDVEGMESDALAGAARTIAKMRPMIYLENDRVEKSASLITRLWEMGYRLWWHTPPLFNPDNHFGNSNNLFGKAVSVNMFALPAEIEASFPDLMPVDGTDFHPLAP